MMHDFDELRVPEGADPDWRHHMTEIWVQRALEYQDHGIDLLLTGQSPLREVLAVCLVDVGDEVRRARLAERDPVRWDAPAVDAFLSWASWHRKHALDPLSPARRHHRQQLARDGLAPPDQVAHR
ncbi:hypothetical protein AB0O64_19065 [Streptomyces sp. NPDC088341]|uniref:hypothetical protein n=1 Tax=Streptomyces sp. NPDC088341 TaxID=3154870 RepID=UPI00341D797D